jgi:hypothetical protein
MAALSTRWNWTALFGGCAFGGLLLSMMGYSGIDEAQGVGPPEPSHVQIGVFAAGPLPPLDPGTIGNTAPYRSNYIYSVSVASPVPVDRPINLTLCFANISGRSLTVDRRRFEQIDCDFAYWITRNGLQVPVATDLQQQVRVYMDGAEYGGPFPKDELAAGEAISAQVDLRSMFRIRLPGHYVVVVEPAPVWSGTTNDKRLAGAVRTAFDVTP